MTKLPNVDWLQVQEDGPIHKSDARQDNMREVRNQLGGSAAAPVQMPDPHFTLKAALAACQCPYGWHAVHTGCYSSKPVPQYDGWPIMTADDWLARQSLEAVFSHPETVEWKPRSEIGVGESMFSPEEIAQFREAALAVYHDSMNEVQAANAIALLAQWNEEDKGRYLEGDTEFSDNDIEDYYLRRAT